jgi:hypothetical protein
MPAGARIVAPESPATPVCLPWVTALSARGAWPHRWKSDPQAGAFPAARAVECEADAAAATAAPGVGLLRGCTAICSFPPGRGERPALQRKARRRPPGISRIRVEPGVLA